MERVDSDIMVAWQFLPNLVDYDIAVAIMEQYLQEIIDDQREETVLLLEHSEVYTAGTSYNKQELLDSNILVKHTGRGGKSTYHGAGQRVIYPILDLKRNNRVRDIKLYVRNLEEWIINSLAQLGVKSYRIENMVGIWVSYQSTHAKIAAIGIRVRRWVTYHGIAINITTDLTKYSGIISCGVEKFPVTSLDQLGIKISMSEFDDILKSEFKKIF